MVDWNIFGNIHQDTGYTLEVLDYIWEKYDWVFRNPKQMYNFYTYIHIYPTTRQSERVFSCSKWSLEEIHLFFTSVIYIQVNIYFSIFWTNY